MSKMKIKLSWHEVAMASEIGRLRNLTSIKNNRKHTAGYKGNGWDNHIEGACGELAVAKCLDRYWDGSIDTFKAPDLCGFQVRTALTHKSLIIRPVDSNDEIFVLVTGICPDYEIHGWIRGTDGKKPAFLKSPNDRPAAYFVPINVLNNIDTLRVVNER